MLALGEANSIYTEPVTPGRSQSFDFTSANSSSAQCRTPVRSRSSLRTWVLVGSIVFVGLTGAIVGGRYAMRPHESQSELTAEAPTNAPSSPVKAEGKAKEVSVSKRTRDTSPVEPLRLEQEQPAKPKEPDVKHPVLSQDEILARVKKSTALIEAKDCWGTGFVIRPGLIVTNAHVIAGRSIRDFTVSFVSLDDTAPPRLKAVLLFLDIRRDLAILRVDSDRPPLETAGPGLDLQGLEVAVVGNPKGDANQAEINKVTTGRLSAPIRRDAGWTYYELSATAYFGNSGGPVVDLKSGKLVGVMQSILGDGKSKSYCIPFGEAIGAINALPAKEHEPKAVKIAAGRHALEYISGKLPEIEKNASRAMDVQCTLLRIKAQGPRSRYVMEDGSLLSKPEIMAIWTEVMHALKEPLAEVMQTIDAELLPAIKASAEIPTALKDLARQRVVACEYMRELANSTTDTEKSFQRHMIERRSSSIARAKEFDAAYKKYLDAVEVGAAKAK
jgi:S1-C subfamily serine protease